MDPGFRGPRVPPDRVLRVAHGPRVEAHLQVGHRALRVGGVIEAPNRLVVHEAADQLVVVQVHDLVVVAERDSQHLGLELNNS